jgi:hypothetical protein
LSRLDLWKREFAGDEGKLVLKSEYILFLSTIGEIGLLLIEFKVFVTRKVALLLIYSNCSLDILVTFSVCAGLP